MKDEVEKKSEETTEQEEVSKETTDLWNAAKQLISIHDMLHRGTFEGHFAQRLVDGVKFISSLHAQTLKAAKERPDFELLPEFQNLNQETKEALKASEKSIKKSKGFKKRK